MERRLAGDLESLAERVADELGRLGWQPEPLASGQAPSHLTRQEEEPPPKSRAGEESPVGDPTLWERLAHEEADRTTSGK